MNEKEMRELDAWIAEHAMGWRIRTSGRGSIIATSDFGGPDERDYCVVAKHPWDSSNWSPTTNPADAFAVLEKCAKRVVGKVSIISYETVKAHCVSCETGDCSIEIEAQTLPLAICLFAKQLFSK